jgi:hypothetical protein
MDLPIQPDYDSCGAYTSYFMKTFVKVWAEEKRLPKSSECFTDLSIAQTRKLIGDDLKTCCKTQKDLMLLKRNASKQLIFIFCSAKFIPRIGGGSLFRRLPIELIRKIETMLF